MGPNGGGGYQGGDSADSFLKSSLSGSSGAPAWTGKAIEGTGTVMQGIAGYKAGKFNEKVARFNQGNSNADAVGLEQSVRDQARAAMGEQIASQGASGIELGTGSAADALHQSAINAQLDVLNLQRKAAIKSTGFDIQAASAKAAGKSAFVGGFIKAAGAFAGGGDYGAAGSAGV
jgi:hypothetical protein